MKHLTYNRDSEDSIKPHYAMNSVARSVRLDLAKRYAVQPSSAKDAPDKWFFDVGGFFITTIPDTGIKIGKLEVCFNLQHLDFFAECLEKALTPGRPFAKLHGKWSCLCLTFNVYNELKRIFHSNLGHYEIEYKIAFEAWKDRHAKPEAFGSSPGRN